MTPTQLLLFGLIVFCVLGLLAVYINHIIHTEWQRDSEPIYRTADGGVLSAEVCELLRQANRKSGGGGCTGECNQGRCCTCCGKPTPSTASPPNPN